MTARPEPSPLWTRDYCLTLLVIGLTFGSTSTLLPVTPLMVNRASGLITLTGLVTTIFSLATVTGQASSNSLLRRIQPPRLFAMALCLLGVGTFAYAAAPEDVPTMLVAAGVRGLGFGSATVASAVLVAELAPPSRRGEAVGYMGLAISLPSVVAPASGLYLLSAIGPVWLFLAAGTAVVLGAVVLLRVTLVSNVAATRPNTLMHVFRDRGLAMVAVALALSTFTLGGLMTFAPLALTEQGWASAASFLLFFGVFRAMSRVPAGRAADRFGPRVVFLTGMSIAIASLVTLAASSTSGAAVATSAALYGLGIGTVQTASYLSMLERREASDTRPVTTFWSVSFDSGISLGGVVLGLVAAGYDYSVMFWVLPFTVGLGFLLYLFGGGTAPGGPARPRKPAREASQLAA